MSRHQNSVTTRILYIAIFSIAMGFLEAAVVVYLRQLYYPGGFGFPLRPMVPQSVGIEILREVSTIVMLIAVGMVTGRTFLERLAFFLISFGIWDIFYYLWLKLLLNWPLSVLEWDILFLIPFPWVGPVLSPVICSVIMILLSVSILYADSKNHTAAISPFEWLLLIAGALTILITYLWEFGAIVIGKGFLPRYTELAADPAFQEVVGRFVPASYNWYLFFTGELLILSVVVSLFRRGASRASNRAP